MSTSPVTVGAVAYHPRVVTIWERFSAWFAEHGAPTDYVLYSNYERLVEALLVGAVEIGWNTNTAFVALERRLEAEARILGMRDIDASFASVVVARRDERLEGVRELAGRRLALGSRDSGHAAILPLHYLREQGLDAERECRLVRFDTDLGKHGDTGDSELRVVQAVASGDADAGALGDVTWARLRAEGPAAAGELRVIWRSPTYYHCNFSALSTLDEERAAAWSATLLRMDHDDPAIRSAMDLEGVRRWLPGDRSGYESLFAALGRADGAKLDGATGAPAATVDGAPAAIVDGAAADVGRQ
jgi:phosphonate transport system substrate-binding protein